MAVEWEDIQGAATRMFSVWTSGGDLSFAKEAWGHLAEAGLTEDESPASETQSLLRLVALCRIYEQFSAAKWDEDPDTPILYMAEDLPIDSLSLGLLAAEHLDSDEWRFSESVDMLEAALTAVVDELEPGVQACLIEAYGGETGLYKRLCRTASNREEDEDDSEDFDPEGPNVNAYAFLKDGKL